MHGDEFADPYLFRPTTPVDIHSAGFAIVKRKRMMQLICYNKDMGICSQCHYKMIIV